MGILLILLKKNKKTRAQKQNLFMNEKHFNIECEGRNVCLVLN